MNDPIKILIVDDNAIMRRKLRRSLAEFDCTCVEATNGNDALDLIANHKFDLIILDLKLPGMNGLETFERAQKIQPELGEVIFITGYPDDNTQNRARILGAYAYLSKAFNDSNDVTTTVGMALTLIKRRTNPIKVFISYARADRENLSQESDLHKVNTIYERLRDNHFDPWFDEQVLRAGQYWEAEIVRAVNDSQFFLACLSSYSSLKVSFIQKEFTLAWIKQNQIQEETPRRSYIIPIRLEEFELPHPFSQLQHIDYFRTNWFKELNQVIATP